MKIDITGPEALFRPGSPLYDQVTFAATRGIFVNAPEPGGVARINKVDSAYVPEALADGVVAAGGDIENYARFIVVPEAKINDPVPEYMPNRTYSTTSSMNEEETESVRTWAMYHGPHHTTETIADDLYISTASFGSHLLYSIQKKLVDDGFKLISPSEFVAARPAPDEAGI